MQSQDYIREFATIFFIRKGVILSTTLGALIIGVLMVLFWPSTYQAEGALILKGSHVLQSQETLSDVNAKVNPFSETDLYSEMEILQSQDVISGAVERLTSDERFGVAAMDAATKASFIRKIQNNLSTSLIPRSNVIRAAVIWGDPDEATTILSNIFEEYMRRRQAVFNPHETEIFFKNQLDSFRIGLEELESHAVEVAGGASANELNDRISRNIELQGNLRRELNDKKSRQIEKETYVKYLERSVKEKNLNFFTTIDNLDLGDFAKKIQDLLIEREEQLKVFTPKSPEVKRTQEQLERLYAVYHREVNRNLDKERNELQGIEAQIVSLTKRIEELDQENRQLYAKTMDARRLDREREVMEESYKTFATRFREAKIRNETQSDRLFTVGVVEQPNAASRPVFPNALSLLPTCLLLGLILGITAGFFTEFFDHRFKRPEDVVNNTNLPYLFSIPHYSSE